MSAIDAVVGAWQQALAAEHEAVFGYQLLGPRLHAADQLLARRCQAAHEAVRDEVQGAMAASKVVPVAPSADYPSLGTVTGAAAARRLAVRLEQSCAAAWREMYLQAATPAVLPSGRGTLRGPAQVQLTASAVRAARWRALVSPHHATVAFPGL